MVEKKDTDSEIIAYSFDYPWSRKRASQLFLTGNLIRFVAILLLLTHALFVVDKKIKSDITYSLLGYALLQWLDILSRYPLSVKEYEQRRGVKAATICYVVLSALYVTAIFDGKVGVFALILLGIISAIFIRQTQPAAAHDHTHA